MLWTFVLSLLLAVLGNLLANFFTPESAGTLTLFLNPLSFFLCFFIFFFLFTHRIVRTFRAITDGLKLIASGNLSCRVPAAREDELGLVGRNINQMAVQLQQQMERERQLEKSKMELITYVSHDLRTPLTSIIGYLDLLKTRKYQNEQEQERFIDNAYNKTQQLKKLIDDLFEYTRLTGGDVRLALQEVDLNSLLEQIITEFEPVAREQGIMMVKEQNPGPVRVRMDVEKIVRAIDNLLTNALKFSERPGEIRIELLQRKDHAVLSIANRGKPVTPEQEERLFERFYKMEPSRSDENMPAGSGLGLSIARHIVELHGGRIWLEHHEGHYKFWMEFMV
ncbi:HAMP domain-containing histidine kinase [Paenibacillus sepulcri]|uniref:histidine kinase n=2 Tax=Paenibacillus sepulcri TaxID=359917 RepID=A0ABS7C0D7_9BACL|nr:HAMP domain-containing histidine kinase [Paenibacillus sepulcri]